MTDLQTKAQALTKLEAERELVRLWELEESLKPRSMDSAPKDGTPILIIGWDDGDLATVTAFWYQDEAWEDSACTKTKDVSRWSPLSCPDEFYDGFQPEKWLPIPKFNLEGEK